MDFRKYKKMPKVGAAMTPFPYSAGPADNVEKVESLMREHKIRHIPVQDNGRVVGIVSERDLHGLANPALPKVDKRQIRVRDVALPNPYVVEIDTPLDQVVTTMAESRIGSAIVVKQGKLVGILSITDICRVLAELLEVRFPGPVGDNAA